MMVALAPRRFLVMRSEEVTTAALMNVDACRHVQQKLHHRRILVYDRHVQYVLTCQSHVGSCMIAASLLYWLAQFAIYTNVITLCVSRRRRKMYCGHAHLCVCLLPYAHTTAQTRM